MALMGMALIPGVGSLLCSTIEVCPLRGVCVYFSGVHHGGCLVNNI